MDLEELTMTKNQMAMRNIARGTAGELHVKPGQTKMTPNLGRESLTDKGRERLARDPEGTRAKWAKYRPSQKAAKTN